MRRIIRIFKDRKAESYLDTVVLVLAAVMVIAIAIRVYPVYITKMQLDNFADELIREAEIAGRVGPETAQRETILQERTGLCPTVSWSTTGDVQLNHEVTVTLLMDMDIGLFGEFASFPVHLRAEATGKSEVYHR